MVFESIVHLVQNSHNLRYAEVNPVQVGRTLQLVSEECDNLVKLDSKSLVYVLFSCSLPGNVLLVLSVAKLEIVLDELPVHRSSSCCLYLIFWCLPEQLRPIVFMQDVDYHGLSSTYDLIAVLDVRKINSWIFFLQLGIILFFPFILRQKGVFLLFVRDQYVLHNHSDDLGLASNGPVNQCYLLLLRNILFLCQAGEFLLLGLLWLLFLLGLLSGLSFTYSFCSCIDVVALERIVGLPQLPRKDIVVIMTVHIVAHMGSQSAQPSTKSSSKSSHPTYASHTAHPSHSSHTAHTTHSSHSTHASHSSCHSSTQSSKGGSSHSKSCISKSHFPSKSFGVAIQIALFEHPILIFAIKLIFIIILIEIIIRLFLILAHSKQYSQWIQNQRQERKSDRSDYYYSLLVLVLQNIILILFPMQMNKRSMDQISLELTEKCIELDSRKYIPSELKLQYSKTQISIQEIPLQPHSPLSNHQTSIPNVEVERLPKIVHNPHTKNIQYSDNLYNIESPQSWEKGRLKMHLHHHQRTERGKEMKEREATSLIAKLPKYNKPQKLKSKSLGLKNSFPPKSSQEKENQNAYKLLKFKLEEEKRKYQSFRVTARVSEIKKGHSGENEIVHRVIDKSNNFLARKIKLDYNQVQQKKYLQRLIMNRQSILHISQRLMQLPAIRQQ